MRRLKKEELLPLRDVLDELMMFVSNLRNPEAPYICRYLGYMRDNIEFCVCTQNEDLERLEELLIRDWALANDMFLGIPSFRFLGEEESFLERREKQMELYFQYISLVAKLEKYFIC